MPYQQKIYHNPDLFSLKVDFVTLKPDFLTLKFKVQKSTLREENLLLRRKNLVLSRFFYRNLTFRDFVPRQITSSPGPYRRPLSRRYRTRHDHRRWSTNQQIRHQGH